MKNNIKLLSCQSRKAPSARAVSHHQRNCRFSLGSWTSCRAPNFAVPYKSILFVCRSTNWWLNACIPPKPLPFPGSITCISKCQQHDLSLFHMATVLQNLGVLLQARQQPPGTPRTPSHCHSRPGTAAGPRPHQPVCPCRLCASAGRATSSLHGLKPSLKNRVCMFVAPQGILSQVQLYWLKHLPQENLDTETLMGPYILGLCNILFYLFIVFINKNAALTTEINFLSNYSHLL